MNKRFKILFSGTVQGVGFRCTARQVAKLLGIKGTVQNLSNRKVLAVCECTTSESVSFIEEVRRSTQGHVTNFDVVEEPPTGEFESFEIIR